MSKLIEGFWSCDKCGREKIRSRYDSCPGCGSRRNINTKYEMLDASNYVDADTAKNIDRNPDWLCPYCNNLNRANSNSCSSCGASKDSSTKDYFQNKREREVKEHEQNELDEYYNTAINDECTNENCLEGYSNNSNENNKFKTLFKNISNSIYFKISVSVISILFAITLLVLIFKS